MPSAHGQGETGTGGASVRKQRERSHSKSRLAPESSHAHVPFPHPLYLPPLIPTHSTTNLPPPLTLHIVQLVNPLNCNLSLKPELGRIVKLHLLLVEGLVGGDGQLVALVRSGGSGQHCELDVRIALVI